MNNATNVHANHAALGDQEGMCFMHVTDPHNLGMNKVAFGEPANGVSVPMRTGDSMITSVPKLMKIDAEGFELPILKGCATILAAHHPVIIVESELVEPVQHFLARFGYTYKGTFNATPTHVFE